MSPTSEVPSGRGRRRGSKRLLVRRVALVALAALAPSLAAQDEQPVQPPEQQQPAPQQEQSSPEDEASSRDGLPRVIREQRYYVPIERLEDVFQNEEQGIFLPYQKFLELWESGMPKPPIEPPDEPPAKAVLRGARYSGKVEGDVATLDAVYGVESLAEGWTELALPLAGVAVEAVEVTEEGGATTSDALLVSSGDAYSLFLRRRGRYELRMTISVRVESEPGRRRVRFSLPPAAVSRLELAIPEPDLRVDVEPNLAVTQTAARDDVTEVVAYLGNAADIRIDWTPKIGKAGEGGAIVFAKQAIHTHLDERTLKIETDLDYTVLRGEVDTFRVSVPTGTRVLRVDGQNIRQWTEEENGAILVVQLHGGVRDAFRLSLTFERILQQTPQTLALPFPRALDVLREEGHVVLSNETGLEVRVADSQGLSQLDPDDVPEAMRPHLGTGFRYLAHPLALDLSVAQIAPVVRAQSVSVIALGDEEDVWLGWIDYDIARAGIFSLRFRVPATWSVESVGPPDESGAVDPNPRIEDGPEGRTVTVSLRSKAFDRFRLPFRLERDPTAAPGEVTLAPPTVLDVEQDRGLLGVSAPRAIELRATSRVNLLDADVDELFRSGIMGQLSAETALPRAYRYREQPATVTLQLVARRTEIDVVAQHLVAVADGEIRQTHLLDYEVLYAPAETLRFRAPSSLDELLKVEAKQKTQVNRLPLDGGQTLWEVTLTPAPLGTVTLTLTHSQDVQGLNAETFTTFAVPLIQPVEVRGTSGFVAVRKEATLEIVPEPTAMEPIDATELPDKLRGRERVYSAFRYFEPQAALALRLTRHEFQRLATTAVEHLYMRSVLTNARRLRTLATLIVQNTERQYLDVEIRPESIITLSVAGKKQLARKAQGGGSTLIEIPRSAGQSGAFPVVILFEEPVATSPMGSFGGVSLRTVEVRDDVPVGQVTVDLYLPPEYTYMGWSGNLAERSVYQPGLWSRFKRVVHATSEVQDPTGARPALESRAPRVATDGVDLDLPVDGLTHRGFETLAPVGELGVYYVGRRLFAFLDFCAFLAAAVVTLVVLRSRAPGQRLRWAVSLCVVPLAFSWFIRGATGELLISCFLGAVAVAAVHFARGLARRYREYRAARHDLAPDPFLEEATPPKAPAADAEAESVATGAATEAPAKKDPAAEETANDEPAGDEAAGDETASDETARDETDEAKETDDGKKKPRKKKKDS